MTVEFISVGTEILLGNIVNTNAAYLSEQCASLGLSCYYQSVVGDNGERLYETLNTAVKRSDIVILSGGLGPTADDLTKEVAAKVMDRKLYMDEHSKQRIKRYFERRGMTPTDNNWKQAMIPEGSRVIDNENGTAPGVIIESENCKVILLPGPPGELKAMFEKDIAPYLSKLQPGVILSQTVKLCGVSESRAETVVKDLMENQTNPTIAPYAKTGEVHFRVTASGKDEKTAKKLIRPIVNELKTRFGESIFTTEDDVTLEKTVLDLARANNLTVSVAESCTGGMLSSRLVDVPGASDVYKSGFVTYSNRAKRKILGVKRSTLEKYGAVSSQTAEEMVKGLAFLTKADVCVSVTGIAGPDGTEEKPVGLVYIACSVRDKVTVKEFHFDGNRSKIRENAVSKALVLLRQCILEYYSELTFRS